MLKQFDAPQPAGTYRLVIDEEEIRDLSFLAYHRKATMLHVPAPVGAGYPDEIYFIDYAELQAALDADERT